MWNRKYEVRHTQASNLSAGRCYTALVHGPYVHRTDPSASRRQHCVNCDHCVTPHCLIELWIGVYWNTRCIESTALLFIILFVSDHVCKRACALRLHLRSWCLICYSLGSCPSTYQSKQGKSRLILINNAYVAELNQQLVSNIKAIPNLSASNTLRIKLNAHETEQLKSVAWCSCKHSKNALFNSLTIYFWFDKFLKDLHREFNEAN